MTKDNSLSIYYLRRRKWQYRYSGRLFTSCAVRGPVHSQLEHCSSSDRRPFATVQLSAGIERVQPDWEWDHRSNRGCSSRQQQYNTWEKNTYG